MTRRARFLATIAALCLAGCKSWFQTPPKVDPETAVRACKAACDLVVPEPSDRERCKLGCEGKTPTPVQTVDTPTEQPTVSPTATVAPAETAIPINPAVVCTGPENNRGPYVDDVEAAVRNWLADNPGKWRERGWESTLEGPASADALVFAVVRVLRDTGKYDVVAEATGGTPRVAMSPKGDATFHAGYALVTSTWDVRFPSRGSSYLGQCRPRGFTSESQIVTDPPANPSKTSNSSPTPTPAPVAQCPPLWFVTAAKKGPRQQFQAGPGWLIDMTPRFLIDGKDKPCNREKFLNCGVAGGGVDASGNHIPDSGDLCEPSPESLEVSYESAAWTKVLDGYAGKVIGPVGSPFTVTVRLKPGAVDKAGRLMDVSNFYPYSLRGEI